MPNTLRATCANVQWLVACNKKMTTIVVCGIKVNFKFGYKIEESVKIVYSV